MTRLNKLISALVGSGVGALFAVAIYYGFAVESAGCADPAAGECVRTVFGMTQSTLTTALMSVATWVAVYIGPANE